MSKIVVEREFPEAVDPEEVAVMMRESAWCMEQYRIQHLQTLLSRDGLRALCIYDAPDLEAVRKANETAQLPHSRIWAAEVCTP